MQTLQYTLCVRMIHITVCTYVQAWAHPRYDQSTIYTVYTLNVYCTYILYIYSTVYRRVQAWAHPRYDQSLQDKSCKVILVTYGLPYIGHRDDKNYWNPYDWIIISFKDNWIEDLDTFSSHKTWHGKSITLDASLIAIPCLLSIQWE